MPAFWGRGAGAPSNKMWPGPRPTCIPSFILIHPTVWPQYTVTDRHRTARRHRPNRFTNGRPKRLHRHRTCLIVFTRWRQFARRHSAASCSKMAEPIDLPFGLCPRELRWAEGSTNSIVFARWHQCALWESTLAPHGKYD